MGWLAGWRNGVGELMGAEAAALRRGTGVAPLDGVRCLGRPGTRERWFRALIMIAVCEGEIVIFVFKVQLRCLGTMLGRKCVGFD
jgi:hypothetical protein